MIANKWVSTLIALLAGAILPFAFAPYELRPLAFLMPAVLLLLWLHVPRKHIYWVGLWFQLGFFASGVHWVYYSIHLFGNAVAPLAGFVTALFVVGLALIVSLTGLFYERLTRAHSIAVSALVFAVVWSFGEWVRSWLFGGFPWLALGYSQVDGWFSGFAPVFGVYGVGFLMLLTISSVVAISHAIGTRSRMSLLAIAVSIIVIAVLLRDYNWGSDKENALRIRMVQGNVEQNVKFDRNRLRTTLDLYQDFSRKAADDGAKPEVVIWPETAIPTYYNRVEKYLRPFVAEMKAENTTVFSGYFNRIGKTPEEKQVYNAFRALTEDDQIYLKSHLVPFGEFMPFRSLLNSVSSLIDIPMSDLSAGPPIQPPLQASGEAFGISICYEDVFGEEMRFQLPAASILINVSNDAWFGDSAAPYQHQEIAAMRAREFARPLVRVTNTGVSSFISPSGEVLESIPQFEQGYLDRDVMPRKGTTPYMAWGNSPVVLVLSLCIALVYGLGRRKRREREI